MVTTANLVHIHFALQVVVLVICLGAVVLTLNVILLGGNIQFFQAVSLLGYCLFPLDVVAIIDIFVSNLVSMCVIAVKGHLRATRAYTSHLSDVCRLQDPS